MNNHKGNQVIPGFVQVQREKQRVNAQKKSPRVFPEGLNPVDCHSSPKSQQPTQRKDNCLCLLIIAP